MGAELKIVESTFHPEDLVSKKRPARTEEQKAKRREYDRKFRKEHREQVLKMQRDASTHWRAAHPGVHNERTRISSKKAYDADPERIKEVKRKWRAKHAARMPEMSRRWAIRKYGIEVDDYDRMYVGQNGVCAICRQPERETLKGQLKRLSIDHCHQTGIVRGLLCGSCNAMLGRASDDPARLRAAADYLEKAK
jgi:hypothetical protein